MAKISKSTMAGMLGAPGVTFYKAFGDVDPDVGRHPVAQVAYTHESETAYDYEDAGNAGQMVAHTPGRISFAAAHPYVAKHVPTLLGMATNEHRRRSGRSDALPLPDSDLSTDSSALVTNLRRAGVPVPANPANPDAHPTNTMGLSKNVDKKELLRDAVFGVGPVVARSQHTVMPEEREAGYQTFKDIMRQARRAHTNPAQFGPQGDQQRLF
jgi:hypothetical protein